MKKITKLLSVSASVAAVLVLSPAAFAHQTYNLTGAGLTIGDSVNNTDGVSNTAGYAPVGVGGRVAGAVNANIPGTGGLPADYTGALPYNLYHGHHDGTVIAQTTRNNLTGTSATTANSLWKAYATQDASAVWGAQLPTGTATDHPYVAVGGNSWQTGSTSGGLDYNLIHASTGTNNNIFNVTTPSAASGGHYQIDFTVNRDNAWNVLNDPNALLDVALYRGSDTSSTASRTAAFNPNDAGVQGSSLGIGDSTLLWAASQSTTTSTLTYSLIMDATEWGKTDGLLGTLNDGLAGYYTLIVGAHGGATGSALAYTIDTHSFSVVPVPGAAWLLGSALVGLIGLGRRKQQQLAA
ncbi:MAG: hypothetical protein HOP02_14140 [Methylococcaceae bacterium]|nr:hypothetical protein [Methylococcaceae bacterium]